MSLQGLPERIVVKWLLSQQGDSHFFEHFHPFCHMMSYYPPKGGNRTYPMLLNLISLAHEPLLPQEDNLTSSTFPSTSPAEALKHGLQCKPKKRHE